MCFPIKADSIPLLYIHDPIILYRIGYMTSSIQTM